MEDWRGWLKGILFLVFILGLFSLPVIVQAADKTFILATTTSTQDSGLLDFLIPIFERQTGYTVKTLAVGTGEALAMGSRGEADVLLVHAPSAEKEFMTKGHGRHRLPVMHNDFFLVGPPEDPVHIKGTSEAAAALKAIAQARALFLSRGDDSGTHKKEKTLWEKAGISPQGSWYMEAGQGMGATLRIADQKNAYTLVDRGTFLTLKKTLRLVILVEGDPILQNFYSVIEVDFTRHLKVNSEGAKIFADFLISPLIQRYIGIYGVDEYGLPLFFPDYAPENANYM